MPDSRKPATVAVHAGRPERGPDQPLNVPITMASTYGAGGDTEYGRYGNPTWAAFEDALGALEGGRCLSFSSGMGAVTTVLDLVGHDGLVVAPEHSYTGTLLQLADLESRGRIRTKLVDITDTGAVAAACDDAALVWFESPTNPALEIADIAAISAAAHEAGAVVVVDNTFATPVLQQPLALGADIVVHSVTKYLAGHSDALMGAIVTANDELYRVLKGRRDLLGATPGTLEAYLALRGLRTLHLRVERAQANATELARRLADHPALSEVRYPGFGGIVSIVARRWRRGRRPARPSGPSCGCTRRRSAAWSRRSSAGAAGTPSRRRSRTGWSGSRSASRTSTTCGPTSSRRSTAWRRSGGGAGLEPASAGDLDSWPDPRPATDQHDGVRVVRVGVRRADLGALLDDAVAVDDRPVQTRPLLDPGVLEDHAVAHQGALLHDHPGPRTLRMTVPDTVDPGLSRLSVTLAPSSTRAAGRCCWWLRIGQSGSSSTPRSPVQASWCAATYLCGWPRSFQ